MSDNDTSLLLRDHDPTSHSPKSSNMSLHAPGLPAASPLPSSEDKDFTNANLKDLAELELGPLDRVQNPMNNIHIGLSAGLSRRNSRVNITSEAALGHATHEVPEDTSKILAYARLDFDNFTFFVQTLQVVLGRKSHDDALQSSHHAVDVHLGSKKAISRRHAKIFYNFGTQQFELSILGRNGAFVNDLFVEKGITVPLVDGAKIQVGDIPFQFVLPSIEPNAEAKTIPKPLNPSDAINLRSSLYSPPKKQTRKLGRRMSEIRRKSLASATNEEITEILLALGAESIDDIADDDDEMIDVQIQAILEDHPYNFELAIDEEEDELDRLVQQHNLEQGVDFNEASFDDELLGLGPLADKKRPLMGKPAGVRMGKPASIQPPASRLYGRPKELANYFAQPEFARPVIKLEVPVHFITLVQVIPSEVQIRTITADERKIELAPICVLKTLDKPTNRPKLPRRNVPKKPARTPYTADEIPDQFKAKPNFLFVAMISTVLKTRAGPQGLSIADISQGIRDLYPYYKYCPDGWQPLVSHTVKLNKMYRRVTKMDDGEWTYAVDHEYIADREKARLKQQEFAAAKAKAMALRAEELKLRQQLAARTMPRYPPSPYQTTPSYTPPGKQKSIAELASEIRRTPPAPGAAGASPTIKAQLAANRSQSPPQKPSPMNTDTKKSLAYLQKELFVLYKARNLSYNTAITTEIITKALATTIAQVNVIGAKAGCGDNALSFLVEKAPQQVSKILDIALTKSIKEKNGTSSTPTSRASTPGPSTSTPTPSAASPGISRPATPSSGLSKPPSFGSKPKDTLSRPQFSGPTRPQTYKTPMKPPQFLSNKHESSEANPETPNKRHHP